MALEETVTVIDTEATCDRCGTAKKLEQEETQEALGDLRREGWASIARAAYAEDEYRFPNALLLCPPCDAEFKEWAAVKKGKA